MSLQAGRFPSTGPIRVDEGWTVERVTPPSHLFGANGLRTGPDGRIYVAQVSGSSISAIDVATGAVETVSALGSAIVAPDDVAFDPAGDLFVTEVMDARVSIRRRDGSTRVLRDDLPCANGITFHQGRLFVDECRIGGRLMELDPTGAAAPRILLEDIPMPNALEMGPDGKLYFPVMGANEIWRIDPAGGAAERVAGDLGVPDAVKFDAKGFIVSTQVHSGEVLRIDPRTGDRTLLASLHPGLDNLTFVDGRLFVSNFTGAITEILRPGETRDLLPGGLNWPLDMTTGDDGRLYVSDGTNLYVRQEGGGLRSIAMLFTPGYPGFIRGITATGDGAFVVTNSNGQVMRYAPDEGVSAMLAEGLAEPCGVAIAPGGTVIVADPGAGRVVAIRAGAVEEIAAGLAQPTGVAIGPDGERFVSEATGGRIVRVDGGGTETVIDGLGMPQGILVRGGILYIVDSGAKAVLAYDLERRVLATIATNLPLGAPPGVVPKKLLGLPPLSGPQGPFAGIAAGPDGTLFLSADGDGSVLALRPR